MSAAANPNTQVAGILQSMPIRYLIAEPLLAAAEAQVELAKSTIGFIKEVGLKNKNPDQNDDEKEEYTTTNVEFKYKSGGSDKTITAPILAIVNIPSLYIQEVSETFEVVVDAMSSAERNNSETEIIDSKLDIKLGAKAKLGPFKVSGSFAYNRNTKATLTSSSSNKSGLSTKATYRMNVVARNERPEGLDKILDILASTINQNTTSTASESAPAAAAPVVEDEEAEEAEEDADEEK